MSSKRGLRRKSCRGKVVYQNSLLAQLRIPYGLMVYKCQFGDHWHRGHPTRSARQSLAAKRRNDG